MKLTLEEIARQAGVSRSTVSRVMNDHPNVDSDTRSRVLAIVENLNYHPNIAARGLAAGHSRILGLVIPQGVSGVFSDPYFPLLIQGISSASSSRDHSVMLWLTEPESEGRTISQILNGGLIEGVIVSSVWEDDAVVVAMTARGFPFILVGRSPNNPNASYVDVDNKNSAREAVAHLLRLGRRRVATIAGPQKMVAGADRLQGYLDALHDRGITQDSNLIVEGDWTEAGGYSAMQRLLRFAPDSVFAASDVMAIGALRALREAGKRVPEDIAIVGYDDMPFGARTDPPLTTVRQPIYRLGTVAAETLIELIADPDSAPRQIVLPTELVIRESCGVNL